MYSRGYEFIQRNLAVIVLIHNFQNRFYNMVCFSLVGFFICGFLLGIWMVNAINSFNFIRDEFSVSVKVVEKEETLWVEGVSTLSDSSH